MKTQDKLNEFLKSLHWYQDYYGYPVIDSLIHHDLPEFFKSLEQEEDEIKRLNKRIKYLEKLLYDYTGIKDA